jgi:hypothetical protein
MKRSITPQEFVKLSLSEAIEWVILDIQRMIKSKIDIRMSTYMDTDFVSSKICSVCLAGAAIVGFEYENIKGSMNFRSLESFVDGDEKICNKIKQTFNGLRFHAEMINTIGIWTGTFRKKYSKLESEHDRIWNKYGWNVFNGMLSTEEEKQLIEYLKEVSVLLKKYGL